MIQPYFNFLRSYIGYKTELKPFIKPFSLTLAVTKNCNLRCSMCYSRLNTRKNELNLQEIENIFSSRTLRNLISLSITGGEPFLRDDIVDIATAAAERIPNLKNLRFATNGTLTEKIVSSLDEIIETTDLQLSVKISIDGMECTHDKVRGVPGTFSKATSTLRELERLRESHDIQISISFTAMDENIEEIGELYDRFRDEIEFSFKPAQNFYRDPKIGTDIMISEQNQNTLIKFMSYFMEKEFHGKRSLWQSSQKMFYRYMFEFIKHPNIRVVPCSAGFSSLFIDSDGTVYPCSVLGIKLGNIRKNHLDDIWYSHESSKIRRKIKKGACACYTTCDIGPSIATTKWHQILIDYLGNCFRMR